MGRTAFAPRACREQEPAPYSDAVAALAAVVAAHSNRKDSDIILAETGHACIDKGHGWTVGLTMGDLRALLAKVAR